MLLAIRIVGLFLAVGGLIAFGSSKEIALAATVIGILLFVIGGLIEGFIVRGKKNRRKSSSASER